MPHMRFAISIPQFYGDGEFDPGEFRAYFHRAEELGFHSAWAQESVLGSGPQLAPLEVMTYAAAVTERIRLGCVVFVSTLHTPAHLAKSLGTLDQLSGGRVEIGIGTGGKARPFAAFGLSADRYVARFTEGLALMKALWTDPVVTFEGEFWQLNRAGMEPKPVQKPHPPIWFGANGPTALRRAARLGDGFFGAGSSSTAQFAEQVQVVRAGLAESGRSASDYPIAKRVYIVIDDDRDRATQSMSAAIAQMYGRPMPTIEAAAVTGTPDDCAAQVAEVAAAGAELILFTSMTSPAVQMERIAAEVIPQLAVS